MDDLTLSEQLFEEFCRSASITCERILPSAVAGARSPDYRIRDQVGDAVIVEVKQFDPSPEEKKEIEAWLAGKVVVRGGVPGARLREVIDRANVQLKTISKGQLPGLLVIYNNVLGDRHHTDPYAILTAMRGLDVVPVVVPKDPRQSPTFLPSRPGPKKKLRADANTHISAIAVLERIEDEQFRFIVYHNPHARKPINAQGFVGQHIHHLMMRGDQSDWERAHPVGP
jgi:hypothetical protein